MKWIGQHIVDLIARFRSDVYLEDITVGTIVAESNLGLDVNNKVVRNEVPQGDITGVTITTDSGGGSAASDTGGSADFSILGTSGVGVTNSGTTITATSVPGEIDHDSLLNFASNEHFTQANITTVGTIGTGVWNADKIAENKVTQSQIINLKGYGTVALNYQYPEDSGDPNAPFQLAIDYGDPTIADSVTVGQSSLFRASGFHFPFACVLDSIQYQATVNNSSGGSQGDITVALVQYVPRETGTNDYFRETYDEQAIVGIGTNNRVKTVDVSSPGETAIAAGSHMIIMFKGDADSVGDTAVISVAMKITY